MPLHSAPGAYRGISSTVPLKPVNDINDILRIANAHYSHIASHFRASLRKTNHARKRAAALNLSVDIFKAIHCEQRQVSQMPLPILDTNPSPPAVPIISFSACAACDDERAINIVDSKDLSCATRNERPVLQCSIPLNAVAHAEPCSKFSADSGYSAFTFISPVSSSISIQERRCSIVEMTSPFINEDYKSTETQRANLPVIVAPRPIRPRLAGVPADVSKFSWNWQDENDMELSSAYLTSDSSNGLITPEDDADRTLVVRIKRKSICMEDIDFRVLGKRPRMVPKVISALTLKPMLAANTPSLKFERKEWVQMTNGQQRNIVRLPPLRR